MTIIRRLFVVFAVIQLFCGAHVCFAVNNVGIDSRARKLETKADKAFIRGDFDKAMKMYVLADNRLDNSEQKHNLRLKMARLYILLQMSNNAIDYYGSLVNEVDQILTVNDVCFYIDALRQQNRLQEAEIVARKYAMLGEYSLNQRYKNISNALANQQHYYNKGVADYSVTRLPQNSNDSEYWIGEWNNNTFYAVSTSRMKDPLKVYYHQTRYLALEDDSQPEIFYNIPRDLHSGPVAFTANKDLMIATKIAYRNTDHIISTETDNSIFVTQLYYSRIDKNNVRWSRFEPIFPHQEGYNYAHPVFFNNDQSIIFSSDRPGGYGGMDLHISHWNDAENRWGDPVNLGPLVNTEGDEIYPRIIDNTLFFSSNGLEGFGGYDIYRIGFQQNKPIHGTLSHFPYPINSVFNDFGLYVDGNNAYFVSDRNGPSMHDDLYVFDISAGGLFNGVSEEQLAMEGSINIISGLTESTVSQQIDLEITPLYNIPQVGELLISVYFNFNKYNLNTEALNILDELLTGNSLDYVAELYIIGYADDIGGARYNQRLSENRAQAVANHISKKSNSPQLFVEGRGQISLTEEQIYNALNDMISGANNISYSPESNKYNYRLDLLSFDELVKLNSSLRRVDIIVKKKQ